MTKTALPEIIRPIEIDGVAAMMVAESQAMAKRKGEYDTEFVKRIVAAYFNACGFLEINPINNRK